MSEELELLTVPEASRWLRIGTNRIYRLINENKIAAVRFSERGTRIPLSELKRYVEANLINSEVEV